MYIDFVEQPLSEITAECEVVFIVNKQFDHKWVTDKDLFESYGFKGESEESLFLIHQNKLYLAIEKIDHEEIRNAAAKATRILKKSAFKTARVGLYTGGDCIGRIPKAMVEGFVLGEYSFDTYKSKPSEDALETIFISSEECADKEIPVKRMAKIVENAKKMGCAVNWTRELVNTPPDDATPVKLAEKAEALAKECNLEVNVYDEKWLEDQKMGCFLAVSRASVHPPRLIHLTYKPENPKARIVLVGKGLTYDSGGLSLKPGDYMTTMKADKGGGCAVMGILKAVAETNLSCEVHGIIGATENMIGGNAYKPDDVLKARNGKTVEVKNTDAEGRLVLADCLSYAQELKPDYLFDLATLTGACVVGLGEYTSGVMGWNKDLKNKVIEAADFGGEYAADLPFNRYLKKLLKSDVADMPNIGSARYGGAITAGLFLSEFIGEDYKDKWIHLDIAGPAYVEKEWGVNPFGASGAGVRLVTMFINRLEANFECEDQ